MKNVKFLLGAAAIALTLNATVAHAATEDINATATFSTALALTDMAPIQFGTIVYSGTPTGFITLGTNNSTGITGTGYSIPTGVAGSVVINGTQDVLVDITCTDVATLSNAASNLMSVTNVEYAIETGVASGGGTQCQPLAAVAGTHTIGATAAENTLLVAARIDGDTAPVAGGLYSTGLGGGVAITFTVDYQ